MCRIIASPRSKRRRTTAIRSFRWLNDGYSVVQVAFGKRRSSRVNKPLAGHLAKAGVEAGHVLKEFPVPATDLAALQPGDQIPVSIFAVGQKVDRPSARAFQVGSSGITSNPRVLRTAILSRIRRSVQPEWHRIRVAFFRVRKWRVIWALSNVPNKT